MERAMEIEPTFDAWVDFHDLTTVQIIARDVLTTGGLRPKSVASTHLTSGVFLRIVVQSVRVERFLWRDFTAFGTLTSVSRVAAISAVRQPSENAAVPAPKMADAALNGAKTHR
jgi:hypothetical protein